MKRGVAFCLMGIAWCALALADTPTGAPGIPTLASPAEGFQLIPPDQPSENDRGNPLDQGGETCATATPILSLPYCDTGTTAGHINDYVPPCNTPSTAPDVVYSMTPPVNAVISVSLCGSSYNTVLHIWRGCPGAGGVLICCDDDDPVCTPQSCCQNITVTANLTYYIIVDGNGTASGNYSLSVAAGTVCPQPCPPDTCSYPNHDLEPNNVCNANNPTISCPDTVCGNITAGDGDYYRFQIPTGSCATVTIDVFGNDTPGQWPFGRGLDPDVCLYDAACTMTIACDLNSGIGNDARIVTVCLPAGLYKLRVSGDASSTTGPYILALACQQCQCPPDTCPYPDRDVEPANNGCNTSCPVIIQCGDTVCGEINPADDSDGYCLFVPGPNCQRITIDVFGNDTPGWWPAGGGLDPRVWLYSADCGTLLGFDNDGGVGEDSRLVSDCLDPGFYQILVQSWGAAAPTMGPYILATHCDPCPCPQDTCPYPDRDVEPVNNACNPQCPIIIQCGDTLCGTITPQADVDWYCLQMNVTPCGIMTIDVFGNDTPGQWPFGQGLDPRVSIYAPDCLTLIASDDNGGDGNDARVISPCLPPGYYAIKVEGVPPTMGPYVLAVHCTPCQCPDTCTVVCPGFATREGEPCPNVPDNFNAGCNSLPLAMTPIHCGETMCGTAFAQAGTRDTDWYRLVIEEPDTFFWCVEAEFPFEIAIFAPGPGLNPCLGLDTLDCATGDSCETPVCIGACMAPGIYFLYIAPTVFDGVDCRDYVTRLICTICGPRVCEAPDSVVIHYPTVASNDIHLYWPPVPGADGYRIYRSNNSETPPGPATFLAAITDTHFVDTGVIGGAALRNFYKVVAHCPYGDCTPAAPAARHVENDAVKRE